MATATEYAKWLVENQDKRGTPEFEKVSEAYRHVRTQATESATTQPTVTAARQSPYPSYMTESLLRGAAVSGGLVTPPPTKETLATFARVAPVGAAVAFPPTTAPALIGLGLGMAGGELLGQHIEGKNRMDRDAAGDAVKAFTMGAMGVPAVAAGRAGLMGASRAYLANTGKMGAASGLTAAAGESAKRFVEGTPQYENLQEAWKDVAIPALFGTTMGFGATMFGRLGANRAADTARKVELENVGITDPTLAMVRPELAAAEETVAATRGALQEKIAKANDDSVRFAYGRIGEAAGNAEIGSKLEPYIRKVDDAAAVMEGARKEADAARQALAVAEKNAQLPPAELQKITRGAQAAILNADMQRASANYALAAGVPDFVSPTRAANAVGEALSAVKTARSGVSAELYGNFYNTASQAAGRPITPSTPIFDKDAIVSLAETSLAAQHRQNAPYAKDILSAIRETPGVKMPVPDPKTGVVVDREFYDKATVDTLKDRMAQKFVSTATTGTMNAADAAVGNVYNAINTATHNQMATMFGPAAGQALEQARAFHRVTSQLEDSTLGRALLRKANTGAEGEIQNVAEHAIESLANGIAHGRVDELNKFKEFVDTVGQFTQPVQVGGKTVNPAAAAALAKQTMVNAVRNAFQSKHLTPNGVNYPAMLDDLLKASQYDKLPFPVEKFGFGSPERVKLWRDTLRTFKGDEVTDEVVGNMLQNPEVRRVIEHGGFDGKAILRGAAAEEIFARKVKDQVTLEAAGLMADARRAAEGARTLAAEHGAISRRAAETYEKARANPLLGAFEGRGNYKFKDEAQKTGEGTVYNLVRTTAPQYRSGLMGALRENNPQLAEIVERRVLTDELGKFVRPDPQKAGGFRFDVGKVREYFNPLDKATSEVAQLRDMVGPEAAKKMESLLNKFAEIEAGLSRGRVPTPKDGENFGRILGIAALPTTGLQGAGKLNLPVRIVNTIVDLWHRGSYNTISNAVLDKGFAGAVVRHSDDVSKLLAALPPQKAFLVMSDPRLMAELKEREKATQKNP